MAFTDEQRKALKAKLSFRHVKTRASHGSPIAYVEGWHVIAEANRIFGYDSWDRVTMAPRCLWTEMQHGQTVCFYTAKVRITVRAGGAVIVREGIGTGSGRSGSAELAHEVGLKAAETDATKRALATFGNPFGLALYDRGRAKVTKAPRKADTGALARHAPSGVVPSLEALILTRNGRTERFARSEDFVGAALSAVSMLPTVNSLYEFWHANSDSFAALKARAIDADSDPVPAVVSALKARARVLGKARPLDASPQGKVAPVALAIAKEKRLRSKPHLAFVAQQPCLICGRRPAHAHHLKFAQPRAMAMKVSDEYTVPLCAGHHDSLHKTADEQAWWARHGILEPMKIAARLWAASRHGEQDDEGPAQNRESSVEIVASADDADDRLPDAPQPPR